ncbi:4a-hydroxytetrahydrobiopterin dehydratase [uncultured bacterium]|nr:4a-hydroxytetrahydrobiopterin dehydratase [uncultured bacterium]
MKLSDEKCARVEKGQRPLSEVEAAGLSKEVGRWALKGAVLEREFGFKGFGEAMEFVNRVAGVAAAEDHHPDICVSYNKVSLKLSTHKIGGLTRNDFIMAAKIDGLGAP